MKEACFLLIDKIEKLENELKDKDKMINQLTEYLTRHDIWITYESEHLSSKLDEE